VTMAAMTVAEMTEVATMAAIKLKFLPAIYSDILLADCNAVR
jgi:hypothetical protein